MFKILLGSLKSKRISFLIFSLGMIALIWMFVAIFPTIRDQSASMEAVFKMYPESLMKAFNVDVKNYISIGGYLASELFSFMWPIMMIAIILGFAGSAIAGEIERGTIEFVLAAPVSRLKLFAGRYLAGVSMIVAFCLISSFAIIPVLRAYNISYDLPSFSTLFIACLLFSLATFSLAMFFSSVFSDQSIVYFVTIGLLVAMYVLNILASLKDNLSDLKYFSFFYYFNANNALIDHKITSGAIWVFAGVTVAFAAAAALWFIDRDIST